MTAIQQVQSTLSSEEPLSEEAQSDMQGSSLAVPGGGPKRAETFSGFDSKLKPDNINRASSMRTERTGMVFPSRQLPGAISPVAGASPKTKHKRRSSGGGGWSFLPKSSSKEHIEQTGSTGIMNWGSMKQDTLCYWEGRVGDLIRDKSLTTVQDFERRGKTSGHVKLAQFVDSVGSAFTTSKHTGDLC